MSQPTITLSSGTTLPQLGLGVWQVPPAEAEQNVRTALDAGYLAVDTAQMYENETGVGRAVAGRDVFVTTKLNNNRHGRDATIAGVEASATALGVDVLDLFLIHWPLPAHDRYVETWQTLVDLRQQGRIRAIGVSNFQPAHLQRIIDETGVAPEVNQIELHPYFTQAPLREFHARHGIATEAWSPLGQGGPLLRDPVVVELAGRHERTPAQIVLAWHLAIGNIVIPKSVTPSRIAENIDVFDIRLAADEVASISALDRDGRIGPNPDEFNWIPA